MKKLRLLIVLSLLLSVASLSAQSVWYVKQGSTGNGSTWVNAFGDVQSALKVAKTGDQIWVARGKYLPTQTNNRTISFKVKTGVCLYGGFSGDEIALEQRNWKANITVLSGDIGQSTPMDNSFTVVKFENVSEQTVLDGFVIADGEATGSSDLGDAQACGAGILNIANGAKSSPLVVNCRFVNNYAFFGAAIFNKTLNNGICKPTITESEFERNVALLDGGVIYNSGRGGQSMPLVKKCSFLKNGANYGAVVYSDYSSNCETGPMFLDCKFSENTAFSRGEVYYDKVSKGCKTIMKQCISVNNYASVGNLAGKKIGDRADRAAYR